MKELEIQGVVRAGRGGVAAALLAALLVGWILDAEGPGR